MKRRARAWRSGTLMGKVNLPLWIGSVICLFLVALVAYPKWFTDRDPKAKGDIIQEINGQVMAAPFPPSETYPLGSDPHTRDLAARVIYGARPTLLVCLGVVALRLLVSNLMAWGIVWVWPRADGALQVVMSISSAIPSLIFAYALIYAMGGGSAISYIIGLALTGWAEMTRTLRAEIISLRHRPFIEAAVGIGLTDAQIIWRHLMPNLLPLLVVSAALEASNVLLTMAELGFLGMSFGGELPVAYTPMQAASVFVIPEWGGLLAGTRFYLFSYSWLALVPAGAFLLSILGLNLLADGLRRRLFR